MDRAGIAVRAVTASGDRRLVERVGRQARLELVFSLRDGRTILSHAYAEPPFRAGRWFAEGRGLHMIMASSSPGIFGDDRFEQVIVVEPGAQVRLTSQSSLQLHPSPSGKPAYLRGRFEVREGGSLSCHWDPLIPFAEAHLEQHFEIVLDVGARLYWGDALMAGREACGERWRFNALAHELRVMQAGELTYLERFRIAPVAQWVEQRWTVADASFFATAILAGSRCDAEGPRRLHALLAGIGGVRGSADSPAESLLVSKVMGADGVPFHRAREAVRDALAGYQLL